MRKALVFAILAAAGSAAPSIGAPAGNVNGVQEQPRITELAAIRLLEQEAKDLALGQPQDAALPAGVAMTVTDKINQAIAGLDALEAALAEGGPYQEGTNAFEAIKNLEKAEKSDILARTKIEKNKAAAMVVHDLTRAESFKNRAQLFLMGLPTTPKDDAALSANGVSPQTVVHDADISANKSDVTVTKDDVERGRGDAVRGRGRVRRQPKPKPYRYLTVAGESAAPPPNSFYSFEGTSSEAGYTFKTFGRQLFGPFETRFQVGAFDPAATGDTGSACVEFDVEGSSPLQFVAVCGRRINGGVQVFVQSHNGAAGNVFLDSTRIAQVLVTYSGTQFVVKAGIQDTPDFALSPVATVNLTQGATALVAGLGASGLTKGAEIGLDEIFITAQ